VGTVEHIPSVTAALPLVDQQATITGPSGSASVDLLGADLRFARAGGELLRRFSARQLEHQQALAVPAPLAANIGGGPLQVVKLQVGARVTTTVIGATLGEADIGGLIDSQVVLTPISYAQKLAAMPGRINRVFVRVRAGQQADCSGRAWSTGPARRCD
jgi:putative ABC transport system permease protein